MQLRTFEYEADDSTYDINNRYMGIIAAGVYRGYNLDSVSTRILVLSGDAEQILSGGTKESAISILITPQGTVIKETESIQVTLAANSGTTDRVDLIYCQHSFVEVEGGAEATYNVKSGTTDDMPTLSAPKTQVAIAYVTVPAGWTGGDSITYERVDTPNFAADDTIVRTGKEQTFTEEQTFNSTKKVIYSASISDGVLTASKTGKDLYLVPVGDGTQVDVSSFSLGTSYGKIVQIILMRPVAFANSGEIQTPNSVDTFYTNAGDVVTMINVDGVTSGKTWLIASTQSLKKNSDGDYEFDSNIVMGDYTIQFSSLRITSSGVTNKDADDNWATDATIIFRNDDDEVGAYFGLGVLPASSGAYGMLRLENTAELDEQKIMVRILCGSSDPLTGKHLAIYTDSGIQMGYAIINGRRRYAGNIAASASITVDVTAYDLLELYPQGTGTSVSLDNMDEVSAGKEIIIINRNSYSITLSNAGLASGSDTDPTSEDLTVSGKSIVRLIMTGAALFVIASSETI